jgi:type VI secretion system protein ImpG
LEFTIEEGIDINKIGLNQMRIYLAGEPTTTYALYHLLSRQVKEIILRGDRKYSRNQLILPKDSLKVVGFAEDEAVLLHSTHVYPGYRLLEEYFSFPEKFLFVDITNLERISQLEVLLSFEVEIKLKGKSPSGLKLSSENFRLYHTPIVNIFPRDAEPIKLDHLDTKYRIIADITNPQHYEVYSVTSVEGITLSTGKRCKYQPFYSFTHESEENTDAYYYITREVSPWGGWDTYISFVYPKKSDSLLEETISLELLCTNGDMAKRVEIGNICRPVQGIPGFVRLSNITRPTPPLRPQLGKGAEWEFISHLALNFLSIADASTLRRLLEIYDVGNNRANRRRIAGIVKVDASPKEILLHGTPIRGIHIQIKINEKHFEGIGDIELFFSILNEFISLYAPINSFTQLTVNCIGSGRSFEWIPKMGKKEMI